MKNRITLKDPSSTYEVTIVKSASETKGRFSLLEVNLFPGGGNELHYHTTFSEYFEVISGVLSVQIGKEIRQLQPGDSYMVEPGTAHRFFNESQEPALFYCNVMPARNFEKALRIGYGLAADGGLNKKGIPKNFWHGVVLFDLSESYLATLPLWFQKMMISFLSRIAKVLKVEQALNKYLDEEIKTQPTTNTEVIAQPATTEKVSIL